jgi:hypothetical protein
MGKAAPDAKYGELALAVAAGTHARVPVLSSCSISWLNLVGASD